MTRSLFVLAFAVSILLPGSAPAQKADGLTTPKTPSLLEVYTPQSSCREALQNALVNRAEVRAEVKVLREENRRLWFTFYMMLAVMAVTIILSFSLAIRARPAEPADDKKQEESEYEPEKPD